MIFHLDPPDLPGNDPIPFSRAVRERAEEILEDCRDWTPQRWANRCADIELRLEAIRHLAFPPPGA